jgi:hypothetical protein
MSKAKKITSGKVPASPSPAQTHQSMTEIVEWMCDRGNRPEKTKLEIVEKLMLYRFAVKSFNRFKTLVRYLALWVDSFVVFTDLISEKLKTNTKGVDILHIVRTWFKAYLEVLDEYLLLKFGGITREHDMVEHENFLVDRNIASKEVFPNQLKFECFTSCSFYGYRDLTKLIDKVMFFSIISYIS